MTQETLRKAADQIRAGQFAEARTVLVQVLQQDPHLADAWVLLSYAVADADQKIKCLQQALKADPNHPRAQERVKQLEAQAGKPLPAEGKEKIAPFTEGRPPSLDATPGRPRPGPSKQAQLAAALDQAARSRGPREPEPSKPEPAAEPPRGKPAESLADRMEPRSRPISRPVKPARRPLFRVLVVLGAIFGCAVVLGVGGLGYSLYADSLNVQEATQAVDRATRAAAVATGGGNVTLPATWTPTHTPTVTLTPTPRPTRTLTPTPTLPPLDLEDLAELEAIQREVSDLRGLTILQNVESYVVNKSKVRPILETMFLSNGGLPEQVEDEKRELVILGLIKATYNLYDNILNNLADGIGGFYDPVTKQIFVIGGRFGGVEHYIFSHEFDHALVDQHFNVDDMGVYPLCLHTEDFCRAIRALVEGDGSLLMDQWWGQYASPQDYEDIFNYVPPRFMLPDQFPPPYAIKEADFPYFEGRDFVEFLYSRGNWAEVNQAFLDPPQTTEQILHPGKYLAREAAIEVVHPDLAAVLGESWRMVAMDRLGEWGTYLVLGFGADDAARLSDSVAATAAAGWGGDSYLVFYNEETDQTILAAYWIWDTNTEAGQFTSTMNDYQAARFRGASLSRTDGDCWEVNDQASCLFRSGRETLWLLTPNQTLLNELLAAYPSFP